MKANRKSLNREDEAVSPVIAVILMVAITVVLAATVYVWVSGFGSNSSQPAKSIAFTSGATLATAQEIDSAGGTSDNDDTYKLYIVSAASPGLKYSDLTFTLNGRAMTMSIVADATRCDAVTNQHIANDGAAPVWVACTNAFATGNDATNTRETTDLVAAGDHLYVMMEGSSVSGQTFRVLDSAANAIITTLTVS